MKLGDEGIVDLEQAFDVGSGVILLRLLEWALEPVGESVALGQLHAQFTFVEGGKRRRRHAEEPRRDLGIEEMSRHGPGGELEYLEVL